MTPVTLIYGTGNPAKLEHMRKMLAPLPVAILGLRELGIATPEPEESGSTPLENARIKALAYYHALRQPVFACDSGLYIEGLPEDLQPGVHVRIKEGKRMNDAEMIAHYAALVRSLGGRAVARYKNAICLVTGENEIHEHFGDDISGDTFYLVDTPHAKHAEGFPLACLSVHIDSGEYYYDREGLRSESIGMCEGFQAFFMALFPEHHTAP